MLRKHIFMQPENVWVWNGLIWLRIRTSGCPFEHTGPLMYNGLKHPGEYWLLKKNSVPSSSFGNICMSGMLFIHEHIPFLINPLNVELNTICHLLALLGAHLILHVSRIRVNCCICLVDLFECVKMHGPTNPKLATVSFCTGEGNRDSLFFQTFALAK